MTARRIIVVLLRAAILFVVAVFVWWIALYFGLSWVMRWMHLPQSIALERNPAYIRALALSPPFIAVLIWTTLALTRQGRHRSKS